MMETVAALLAPRGRGAVAMVRLCGNVGILDRRGRALFRAANGKRVDEQPAGRIVFGHWGEAAVEEVVLCRRDAETVDIHCHGGDAAVRRILEDLRAAGCEVQSWQELELARGGVFALECAEALSHAATLRTAEILLEQGARLREAVEALAPDNASPPKPTAVRSESAAERIDQLLAWAEFGLHLTQSWSVVLCGRPNVGKSSLINALLGYARSIVFDEPGTTRDVVTAETAFQGWPVQLADTAGLRETASGVEAAGIDRARQQLAGADCRVIVLDASVLPTTADQELLTAWPGAVLVAHKADLPNLWGTALPSHAVAVSSLTGAGVEALAAAIVARLIPRVPPPGTPIPFTPRQVDLLRQARRAVESRNASAFRAALDEIVN